MGSPSLSVRGILQNSASDRGPQNMPVCPEILFCSYKVSYSIVSKFSYESENGERVNKSINQGLTWKRKISVRYTK